MTTIADIMFLLEFIGYSEQMKHSKELHMIEHPVTGEYIFPEDLQVDWNLIMLIWHKLRNRDFKSAWTGTWQHHLSYIGTALKDRYIDEVHEEIVKAIMYYNENK